MKAEPSPAFQFYPKDMLADATLVQLSLAAKGAYFILMAHCWLSGVLPADLKKLAALVGCSATAFAKLWGELALCFDAHPDGGIIDPRIERTRERQNAFRELQRNKGRASAKARRSRSGSIPVATESPPVETPSVEIRLKPKPNSSSSSSSSSAVVPPVKVVPTVPRRRFSPISESAVTAYQQSRAMDAQVPEKERHE